jgi:hypothetical protein
MEEIKGRAVDDMAKGIYVVVINPATGRKNRIPVDNLREASIITRQIIEENFYTAEEWCREGVGDIYYNNTRVAYVSYNGRIWTDPNNFREIPLDYPVDRLIRQGRII